MPISVRTNIASIRAQRQLATATESLSAISGRLASGQRINRASDDAAGLSIATSLGLDSKVFTQASRNLNDGISYLSIAGSALDNMKTILIRQRELATQAANGSYSTTQRGALNTELTELTKEYNRIIDSTSFNGSAVFSTTGGALSLQAGYGANGVLSGDFQSSAAATQNDTRLASVTASGVQTTGSGGGIGPNTLSADGRYAVFYSAGVFDSADTNVNFDIFVKDNLTGDLQRVSTAADGTLANGASTSATISADGRYVTFVSGATNLVASDTNGVANDLYRKDLWTGEVQLVSTTSAGTQTNGTLSTSFMSADGRYVAFSSTSAALVAGDTNASSDVFVKDMVTGSVRLVSSSSSDVIGGGSSTVYGISADGNTVLFSSSSTNLVAGDTNGLNDFFVKNLSTGVTQRVNTSTAGAEGNSGIGTASLSADGRYVSFTSSSSNLVSGDTNGTSDIFVKDLFTGVTQRVSVSSTGVEGPGTSANSAISGDGRYVVFESTSANLVSGDTNAGADIFLKDLQTGDIRRVSTTSSGGQANGQSSTSAISADGRYVMFGSQATNLVASDTNLNVDAFVNGNPFIAESKVAYQEWVSVSTQQQALSAQTAIDAHLDELNSITGTIGAFTSRVQTALSNVFGMRDNSAAAQARILDADVAQESSAMMRTQILQQTATAVLTQANQTPALALQLLR